MVASSANGFIAAVRRRAEILADTLRRCDGRRLFLAASSWLASSTHTLLSQTKVIGSYGAQLLDWLHNYTFVEERSLRRPLRGCRNFSRRAFPLRNDGRRGLLRSASAISRYFLRRGSATRRAHDRELKDDDGCAAAPNGLMDTPQKRIMTKTRRWWEDKQPRAARLCRHAALREVVRI